MTGCDRTTPAALLGLASVDLPAIILTGGPMLNGRFRGSSVGSGTDIWRMTEGLRAGLVSPEEFTEFESSLNRSAGHCMTMGTASSMACLAEAASDRQGWWCRSQAWPVGSILGGQGMVAEAIMASRLTRTNPVTVNDVLDGHTQL